MRIGISYVSEAGAAANRDAEIPARATPDSIGASIRAAWETELNRVRVSGGTAARTTAFYTSLNHALMQPQTMNDRDGRYLGADLQVHLKHPGQQATRCSTTRTATGRCSAGTRCATTRPTNRAFTRRGSTTGWDSRGKSRKRRPAGLPGNDHLGTMSAWYVFAAVGVFPQVTINADRTDTYVQSVRFDGSPRTQSWLPESFVQRGGTVDFKLGTSPGKGRGSSPVDHS